MKCLTHKSEIVETCSSVSEFSFEEKRSPLIGLNEEKINFFLDTLLDFKKVLNEKTDRIHSLNDRIDKITWYNDLSPECDKLINDLISGIKDLHSSLIRQYISLTPLRKKGVAKEEIVNFKHSIDDLKETFQDLESVFFFLPAMPDFKETTKQLSIV